MKIYLTLVAIFEDPKTQGQIFLTDTIRHEGKLWLVPEWHEAPTEGWKTPARIIQMDKLPH